MTLPECCQNAATEQMQGGRNARSLAALQRVYGGRRVPRRLKDPHKPLVAGCSRRKAAASIQPSYYECVRRSYTNFKAAITQLAS